MVCVFLLNFKALMVMTDDNCLFGFLFSSRLCSTRTQCKVPTSCIETMASRLSLKRRARSPSVDDSEPVHKKARCDSPPPLPPKSRPFRRVSLQLADTLVRDRSSQPWRRAGPAIDLGPPEESSDVETPVPSRPSSPTPTPTLTPPSPSSSDYFDIEDELSSLRSKMSQLNLKMNQAYYQLTTIPTEIRDLQKEIDLLRIKQMRHESNNASTSSAYSIARRALDVITAPTTFAGKLVSTAASLAGTLLQDQETEETTSLGDRILNERVANTAINSQQAVGRLVAYSTKSDPSPPPSCSDEPTCGSPGSERFYTYPLVDWTTAAAASQAVTFTPERRLANDTTLFGKTLRQHYLTKCGWRFQVQCNASPFHSGSLLVCAVPEFVKVKLDTDTSKNGFWPIENAAARPGSDWTNWTWTQWDRTVYEDYFSGSPVTHRGTFQWFMCQQATAWPHQILNLRTSTSVSLEVPYVGPTPTNYPVMHASWTLVVFVLTPLQYASGASPIVPITVSVAPVNPVWNGVRHAGLTPQSPLPVAVRENAGMFLSTIPAETTPAYIHSTDPASYLPGEIKDFVDIAKIPSFVRVNNDLATKSYFTISNTSNRDTAVYDMNVIPTDQHMLHSLLGRTCINFTMYSGSLNFDFIFTGTAMMRCKLLIAYTPPGAGIPANREQAMQGTYAVWDVGLNSSYSFCVPFISPVSQRLSYSDAPTELALDGWLSVYQLTTLTYPPGSPTQAHVLVMVSAGPDFSLYNPVVPVINQGTDNLETGVDCTTSPGEDFESKQISSVPRSISQSSIQFFYDRSFFLGFASGNALNDTVDSCILLTPFPSMPVTAQGGDPIEMSPAASTSRYCFGFLGSACFTYYRADLEVTINASARTADIGDWFVHWLPVGSRNSLQTWTMAGHSGNTMFLGTQPVARSYGKRSVSFDIPWTSPLSYFPTTYDGWQTLRKRYYSVPPLAHWGKLYIFRPHSTADRSVVNFSVYIRFKNFRAFCPRPYFCTLPKRLRPVPHRSARLKFEPSVSAMPERPNTLQLYDDVEVDGPTENVWVKDLTEEGVEPNPGPTMMDELSFMKSTLDNFLSGANNLTEEQFSAIRDFRDSLFNVPVKEDIQKAPENVKKQVQKDSAAFIRFMEAEDPIETLVQGWDAVREIQNLWKQMKAMFSSSSFWYDLSVWLIKSLISAVVFLLNPTPSVGLGLTALALLDTINITSIKKKIIAKLTPILGPHPDPELAQVIEEHEKSEETWFARMKKMFNQGPTHSERVTETNKHFQLMKNCQWLIATVKDLYNWIMSWFRSPQPNELCVISQMLESAPEHIDAINHFRSGLIMNEPTESVKFLKNLHDLAFKLGKNQIVSMCSKYLQKKTLEKPRLEPVVVVLRGSPGAGKSVASQILAQALSKERIGRQSVYSMPPDSDHMDGYRGQFCVIQDDLGQNPDGEDFATFCQMVSTTNYIPPMAHLEDKGRPFTSQVIIATTNLPSFSPVTIADPEAVERRITLDLEVRPGKLCTTNGKLDLDRALENIGPAIGPFTQDAMILHRDGLVFYDRRTGNSYSLLDVFKDVISRLDHKTAVLNKLDSLVFQGPSTPSPNDPKVKPNVNGDVKIDCVKKLEATVLRYPYNPQEFQFLLDEITELRNEVARLESEQSEVLKCFVILLGGIGVTYTIVKMFKTGADWYSLLKAKPEPPAEPAVPTLRPRSMHFIDDPEDERAYNPAAKKIVPKKLSLESPKTNLDFERYVAAHVACPFYYWPSQDSSPFVQTCALVCDRFFLVNEHTWMYDFVKFEVRGVTYTREQCNFVVLERQGVSTDLVMVQLPKGQQFRNNIPKFLSRHEKFPPRNTPLTGIDARGPTFFPGKLLREPMICEIQSGMRADMFVYSAVTAPGFCGSPITGIVDGKKKIIGLHSAGANGVAGGISIQIHNIHRAIDYLKEEEARMSALSNEGQIKPLPPGPTIHVPRKSKLRPTIAHPIFKPKAGPAVLSSKDSRLAPGIDFDTQVFSKHTANQATYHQEFSLNTKEYAHHVFSFLGKDNSMISVRDAICGIDFLDPMDKETSPGLPFSNHGLRRTDLIDFENGEILDPILIETLNAYLAGDFSSHCFQTFLKDEIRSDEKIAQGKTRVVDVPNVAHVIVGRMLLGKFCSHFHANPGTVLGSAIGCNPDVDWTMFAQELLQYKYVYDIDYSNFDSTHGTGMFENLIEHFFTEENGFDPLVGPYLRSLSVSQHAWMDQRMIIEGGLPSGCSATSVINTILNNIILRSFLHLTYSKFSYEDVAVLAYGDDLLVASDYQIDFNKVRDKAAEHTLYKLTTANKQPEFPAVSFLTDVQFLKRKFVPHNVSGFIFRPVMDTVTLKTILSYYKPNTMQEKILSVAQLAVHSGLQTYNELFAPFVDGGLRVPSWFTLEREWERYFFS